jgi:hypothetical protein
MIKSPTTILADSGMGIAVGAAVVVYVVAEPVRNAGVASVGERLPV